MKTCPICQASFPDSIAYCSRDGAELRVAGDWVPGTLVRGRYRVLSKIGAGGMGAVYKVKHTGFDEFRAIKVLNPELAYDEKFHERFKREAYITRKLQHPNAVRVDDIDEAEDGCPFIVMEYIEGKDLKRVMEEQGPLSASRACAIAKQVASALAAAHQLDLVHRDIKPENIFLVQTYEDEIAKVLDFGIARVKEGAQGEEAKPLDLTGGGFVVGTPMYISPEQAQGLRGGDLDGRSDLYSLGVVMYQMLTNTVPFQSDTAVDLLIAHIQKAPTPIRLVRSDIQIPPLLAELVMRLLQKDRELRPPSAAALIQELKRIEAQIGGAAQPVAAQPVSAKPAPGVPARAHGTTVLPAPPMPRAVKATPPVAPAPASPATPSRLLRPTSLLLGALVIGSLLWYRATHSPAEEIARHEAAAEDYERQKLYPQSEEEYRAAIHLDPDNGALQSALGHVLIEERKWDDAISTLRAATTAQPEDAVAHNNLGVALQTAGNVADAVAEFREAVRIQPNYLEARSNYGRALEQQNDLAGAITQYQEVLQRQPDDADAHYHLAVVDYKQGNSDGAVGEYREAIRLQPGFALAHFGLGGVLYNRGEHDAGIEELRTAYSLSPDDPEIRAAYQKVLEK